MAIWSKITFLELFKFEKTSWKKISHLWKAPEALHDPTAEHQQENKDMYAQVDQVLGCIRSYKPLAAQLSEAERWLGKKEAELATAQ